MMKTPEKIKKGLECCMGVFACSECPYSNDGCEDDEEVKDALAYIQQLEARIDTLTAKAVLFDEAVDAGERMKRERDAAARRPEGGMTVEPKTIRGSIKGKMKYQRIPIRSKFYEQCMEMNGEVNADTILDLPREKAAEIINALVEDWMYWLKRAGELYIMNRANERIERIYESPEPPKEET